MKLRIKTPNGNIELDATYIQHVAQLFPDATLEIDYAQYTQQPLPQQDAPRQ